MAVTDKTAPKGGNFIIMQSNVITGDSSYSRQAKKLLVFDSEGNFIYENTVSTGANGYLHGHSGSAFIIWGLYPSMRVYFMNKTKDIISKATIKI